MSIPANHPWAVASMPGCMTCSAVDRISDIKQSRDTDWLRAVIALPDNQKTVQQEAERRLRKLTRGAKL